LAHEILWLFSNRSKVLPYQYLIQEVPTMELYYEKSFVKISWDAETGCTVAEWNGFSYGEELKIGMNKILELVRAKKATKTIADLRKMRITSSEDQEWIFKDWTPRAIEAGIKYAASLVPESQLAKSSYDKTLPEAGSGIKMVNFSNLDEAKKWLRSL